MVSVFLKKCIKKLVVINIIKNDVGIIGVHSEQFWIYFYKLWTVIRINITYSYLLPIKPCFNMKVYLFLALVL